MTMTENEIDDRTAFAQGDEFANEAEVRAYFTVESMVDMFGGPRQPDYVPLAERIGRLGGSGHRQPLAYGDAAGRRRRIRDLRRDDPYLRHR